jgi:Mg/Co/Ni transporter MgtE
MEGEEMEDRQMTSEAFTKVIELVEILSSAERAALMRHLQEKTIGSALGETTTRESILAEFERRKAAGAFEGVESLKGKYAKRDVDLSFEAIEEAIHEHSWEDELDEFFGND